MCNKNIFLVWFFCWSFLVLLSISIIIIMFLDKFFLFIKIFCLYSIINMVDKVNYRDKDKLCSVWLLLRVYDWRMGVIRVSKV